MPRKEEKELITTFLAVLDNEDVITKLATVLSASINLVLDEKINTVLQRLGKLIKDNKIMSDRISKIEVENDKLKQINAKLQDTVDTINCKVNILEQYTRKNNIVITGVKESYAERAVAAEEDDGSPVIAKEDTIKTVCSVIKEACNITIQPTDIQTAFRLRNNRGGLRPLLVSFHSSSVKTSITSTRRPKQTLTYRGSNIYLNDHLTPLNSELAHNARQLVKQRQAFASWVRDGQVFVKWAKDDRADRVTKLVDLLD